MPKFNIGDGVVYNASYGVTLQTPWRDKKVYQVVGVSFGGKSIDILVKGQVRKRLMASLFSLASQIEANE